MLWFEISARAAPADVEAVAAMMREVAPGGVTVEEPITVLGPEMGFAVRHDEPVVVRAYLPGSELGAVLTEQLRREARERFPGLELVAKPLYEQDWAVSWREFFGPVDYGGRIVIVPGWVEPASTEGRIVIRLDPGQAFGTGHHETTRLCLAALEEHVRPGDTVLDVGTGSGVLAIAAVRLGASEVAALDVDPVALRVAAANCAENGVAEAVHLDLGTLEDGHEGRYDVVVANISTQANLALLPRFPPVLRPGGRLLLSGILAVDATRVREEASRHGLALAEIRVERDWCLLTLRKPADGQAGSQE
jgi:ribosomal protein L11 methyltransferase